MKRLSFLLFTLCFPLFVACDVEDESAPDDLDQRTTRAPWANVHISATGNLTPAGRISLSGGWGTGTSYCSVGPSLLSVPSNYSDYAMWNSMGNGCGISHSSAYGVVTATCEVLTQPGREVNEFVISGSLQTTYHACAPGSTTCSVAFSSHDYAPNGGWVDVECEFTD